MNSDISSFQKPICTIEDMEGYIEFRVVYDPSRSFDDAQADLGRVKEILEVRDIGFIQTFTGLILGEKGSENNIPFFNILILKSELEKMRYENVSGLENGTTAMRNLLGRPSELAELTAG